MGRRERGEREDKKSKLERVRDREKKEKETEKERLSFWSTFPLEFRVDFHEDLPLAGCIQGAISETRSLESKTKFD